MLPLVLFSGSGSELYRGLGSVILGGIAISTIFTVFVIPSLLMFVIRMEKIKKRGYNKHRKNRRDRDTAQNYGVCYTLFAHVCDQDGEN